jgi:hypothetical protein
VCLITLSPRVRIIRADRDWRGIAAHLKCFIAHPEAIRLTSPQTMLWISRVIAVLNCFADGLHP